MPKTKKYGKTAGRRKRGVKRVYRRRKRLKIGRASCRERV